MAQWIGICLLIHGTRVWNLVQKDSTCCKATKPALYSLWVTTSEPMSRNYKSSCTWSLCFATREATTMTNPCTARKSSPCSAQLDKAHFQCSSVQFSRLVVSDSLWPHGLQHARPPCPSPSPRAYSNSCPSSQRCHPTISSSVVPFSSCLQSFPASGSFPMSQLFTSGGQSIGTSYQVFFLNLIYF